MKKELGFLLSLFFGISGCLPKNFDVKSYCKERENVAKELKVSIYEIYYLPYNYKTYFGGEERLIRLAKKLDKKNLESCKGGLIIYSDFFYKLMRECDKNNDKILTKKEIGEMEEKLEKFKVGEGEWK